MDENYDNNHYSMDQVRIEEVIICTKRRRGNGTTDPIRVILEVFTKSGEKIAEHDPCERPQDF